jgi:hypothetical protein
MNTTATRKRLKAGLYLDPNMRDYSKDPLVMKKLESARAFIAKHGLPEDDNKPKKSK